MLDEKMQGRYRFFYEFYLPAIFWALGNYLNSAVMPERKENRSFACSTAILAVVKLKEHFE